MAKEIINDAGRFTLVQTDKEGTEHVAYQDFTGSSTISEMANHAQDSKPKENTRRIAETLSLLYQLANKKQRVEVVKGAVERSDLSPKVTVNTKTVRKATG